ncbi:MAG TPA: hypothetical protein VHF22_04025 [Planctomycetota bacterium]|nr:hypothetical protein [Planctomycetota bacterium]
MKLRPRDDAALGALLAVALAAGRRRGSGADVEVGDGETARVSIDLR